MSWDVILMLMCWLIYCYRTESDTGGNINLSEKNNLKSIGKFFKNDCI